ncbi:uncharacterized protein LOC144653497 [Oculina patagonica]
MSYQPAPPPYNPSAPPPQTGGVGFEQYQQGSPYPPPPYSAPYPQQAYHGQPYQQHGHYPPYGQPHVVYTEQPKTVYVYDDQHGRRRHQDNDATECFLWGLCAACLCCCLLDS